jgi:hypothetical protein
LVYACFFLSNRLACRHINIDKAQQEGGLFTGSSSTTAAERESSDCELKFGGSEITRHTRAYSVVNATATEELLFKYTAPQKLPLS